MITLPRVTVERVSYALGDGTKMLLELADEALKNLDAEDEPFGAVVAATFSNSERFPSLAVRVASMLGLPSSSPAFDIQMACSAYPYALYIAGRLSADIGGKVLVVDGDAQLRLVDSADHATGSIFSDAVTCSVISCGGEGRSTFSFLSRADESLACSEAGPIKMDGMKVFSFVATEVRQFLKSFIADSGDVVPDVFVPHQANPYMVRQLAKSLGLGDRLLTLDESLKNPGSCSIPLAIARSAESRASGVAERRSALLAGFGAGLSAGAALVDVTL